MIEEESEPEHVSREPNDLPPSVDKYDSGFPESLRPRQPKELLWPHPQEAEVLLQEYQTQMAHLFPFIVIPQDVTAAELRVKRPFLWKAVMMEACHLDGSRQIVLGNQLLQEITEAAIIKPQKSIDLLQGLHILMAW